MSNARLLWSSMTISAALMLSACSQPADETTEASADAPAAETTGKTIRIATEGAYPPFNYTNADGSLSGFDVDVANALCEQMQANCEIVAQDWDGIIPGLLAQKYDAVIAGMSITAERQEKVDFSRILPIRWYGSPTLMAALIQWRSKTSRLAVSVLPRQALIYKITTKAKMAIPFSYMTTTTMPTWI